jgi:hypothetical protein
MTERGKLSDGRYLVVSTQECEGDTSLADDLVAALPDLRSNFIKAWDKSGLIPRVVIDPDAVSDAPGSVGKETNAQYFDRLLESLSSNK